MRREKDGGREVKRQRDGGIGMEGQERVTVRREISTDWLNSL